MLCMLMLGHFWFSVVTFVTLKTIQKIKKKKKRKKFILADLVYKTRWKQRFPMDLRPLVEGCITNFGIFLDVLSFSVLDDFFRFFKQFGFLGVLGLP